MSKAVTLVLKLIYKHIETYNFKTYYLKMVKLIWLLQDNQPAIDAIKKFNSKGKALSSADYDVLLSTQVFYIKI